MPCVILSNNKMLPPNQRAADTASLAVEGIASMQQQKVSAAFHVQGVQAILYHRLTSGIRCSCHSHGNILNSRLDSEGNADSATINNLITGGNFGATRYSPRSVLTLDYSGLDPKGSDLPEIWNKAEDGEEVVGDNGVSSDIDPDDNMGGFDSESVITFGDVSCPICYGTGFVGGFSIYGGYRKVVQVSDMTIRGVLNPNSFPLTASVTELTFDEILPTGVVAVDSFRVMNGFEVVPVTIYIDNVPIDRPLRLLRFCDGYRHTIHAKFNQITDVSHFEIQLNQTSKSAYVEFPKLTNESNLSLLDSTSSFQLLLSPDIPYIDKRDIITDVLYNKHYLVMDTTWLTTRQRQMFGWEVNVRVVQPQESFSYLPKRYRSKLKAETVLPNIGNIKGRP